MVGEQCWERGAGAPHIPHSPLLVLLLCTALYNSSSALVCCCCHRCLSTHFNSNRAASVWLVDGRLGTLSTCHSVARIRWVSPPANVHPYYPPILLTHGGAIEGIPWNLPHSSCIHQSIPEPHHPVDSPIMLLSASCGISGKLPLVRVCLLRLSHCYHRTGHPLHSYHDVILSRNLGIIHGKNRQDSILFFARKC